MWVGPGTGIVIPELPVPQSPSGFSDVSYEDWFYDAVMFVFENGLFKGTSETTFEPNTPMTRAMFVTVLSRLEFGKDEAVPEGTSPFTDLTQDWYKKAVAWAAANGIVNGVSDTEFAPDLPVTREQMAAIMHRYAQYKVLDMSFDEADIGGFADMDEVSDYAKDAMKWAVSKKLITGTTSTTLAPKESATRAQVATIVMRFRAFAE